MKDKLEQRLSYAILQDKINLRKVFKSIDLQVGSRIWPPGN